MNIVILDDWDHAFSNSPQLARIKELGEVTIYNDQAGGKEETVHRLAPAEVAILIRERTHLDRPMIEQLPNLRFIAQTGGGAAHIDHGAREAQGIGIAYTPGSSRQSVVELTFGMAIAALRELPRNDRVMRGGDWPQRAGRTLNRRRLSIIGFGGIGAALVAPARIFGMEITAWGREHSRQRAEELGVQYTENLTEAMMTGDIVTIHVGLNEQTRGVISSEHLDAIRSGSVLINTSRGAIIEEDALLRRLEKGDIIAALDVFHEEPLPVDHPLRSMENVILSPHIGWITDDNYENVVTMCIENINTFLKSAGA